MWVLTKRRLCRILGGSSPERGVKSVEQANAKTSMTRKGKMARWPREAREAPHGRLENGEPEACRRLRRRRRPTVKRRQARSRMAKDSQAWSRMKIQKGEPGWVRASLACLFPIPHAGEPSWRRVEAPSRCVGLELAAGRRHNPQAGTPALRGGSLAAVDCGRGTNCPAPAQSRGPKAQIRKIKADQTGSNRIRVEKKSCGENMTINLEKFSCFCVPKGDRCLQRGRAIWRPRFMARKAASKKAVGGSVA